MNLKHEIIENWKTDIKGFAQDVVSLCNMGFPCWTVKYLDSYGVAIPYTGFEGINEHFSNARIRSDILIASNGTEQNAIILTADYSVSQESFSTLCEALLSPGENGENRALITKSPEAWWKDWKELIGNRDIDERVYDTLGELCVFKLLSSNGQQVNWDGPNSATYDLEMDEEYVEVKSTTSRSKKEVTISSQFQLDPPGKKLSLILCQFESSSFNGYSIDSVVEDLINMGVNPEYLNTRLSQKGLEPGMIARRRKFVLHDMLKYEVNDTFPRITPASFIGGVMPLGITKITYTVSLEGLNSVSLIKGDNNEIQNN